MKPTAGFIVIALATAVTAYNVADGVNIALAGVGLASIWAIVADWMGGRALMYKKTIPQIYQSFRQERVTPLPPLSKAIKAAALLIAIASVAYYLAR